MSKKIKIIITSILFLILLGLIIFIIVKERSTNPKSNDEELTDEITESDGKIKKSFFSSKKEFINASGIYSIKFPKNWIAIGKDKITTKEERFDLILVNKDDTTVLIGLIGPKSKDKNYEKDLKGLQNLVTKTLRESNESAGLSIEFLEENSGQEKNFSYVQTLMKASYPKNIKRPIYQLQKNIVSENNIFILNSSLSEDKYDTNIKIIKEIINSFNILELR